MAARDLLKRSIFINLLLPFLSACTALNAPDSGGTRTIWRADGKGWGRPVFDDGAVYFVGSDHDLVAVNKRTGAVNWRATTSDPGDGTNGRSAVVVGSIVAMGDLDIYGFDRLTGERRWVFHPSSGYDPGLFYLAIDGTIIYAGSPSGRLYALDGATGSMVWMTVISDDGITSVFNPVVANGRVFACVKHFEQAAITGGLVAVSATTGAIQWSVDFTPPSPGGGCNRSPAVTGSLVIGTSQDGHIYALDQQTGAMVWTAPQLTNLPAGTGGSPLMDDRPLTAAGPLIIVGSTTGYVVALDTANGREVWRATANRGSIAAPIVVDGSNAYVTHQGLQLAAFDLSTGALRWLAGDNPGGGEFFPSPAVDVDRLYVGGVHGLYAIRK